MISRGLPALEPPDAAFHAGEVALQRAAGVSERLARLGSQVIRAHLPEQHRDFFPLLPFVVVGSLDAAGQPWASLLCGPPGFITSADERTLQLRARPLRGSALAHNLKPGAALALLGIQPHTKRRNRANGRVSHSDAAGFTLRVLQSFGNCAKYIRPREARFTGSRDEQPVLESERLDSAMRQLMERADTFFIASAHPRADAGERRAHGVDVSHRGGPPGFVAFSDDATFSIPDFRGNNFFNTLGNLRLNPSAGLLFLDFERRDVLELAVGAECVAGLHPLRTAADTGRIIRFHVRQARLSRAASELSFSPLLPDAEDATTSLR